MDVHSLLISFSYLVLQHFSSGVTARCTAEPFISGLVASPVEASAFCTNQLVSATPNAADYPDFARSCSVWPTRVSFACGAYLTDAPVAQVSPTYKSPGNQWFVPQESFKVRINSLTFTPSTMTQFVSALQASPTEACNFCNQVVTANKYTLAPADYPAFAAPCSTWSTRVGFACLAYRVQQRKTICSCRSVSIRNERFGTDDDFDVFFTGSGGRFYLKSYINIIDGNEALVRTDPDTYSGNDPLDRYKPNIVVYDGSLPVCDVVRQCVYNGINAYAAYFSYDVHYKLSTNQWICTQYYYNGQADDFKVTDSDVGESYGYNLRGG